MHKTLSYLLKNKGVSQKTSIVCLLVANWYITLKRDF